jgi:putative FmdB family regulatory protein
MPTYGYECRSCGRGFEAFQRITDDSLTTCEVCGGELKKKIYPVGIVFKGSGFYVNDYASKKAAADEPAPATAEAKSTDASAPASDTPAAEVKAPETKPAETKVEAAPAAAKPVTAATD